MPNRYTEELGAYPYTDRVKREEGFRAKRYTLGNEARPTIGYGHQVDNETSYTLLTDDLGIKDRENLSKNDAEKLLRHDLNQRRAAMRTSYKGSNQKMLDAMLNVRMQFSPQMFDKHFGDSIRQGDIAGLKTELTRLGNVFEGRGLGGVKSRWNRVIVDLDRIKEK